MGTDGTNVMKPGIDIVIVNYKTPTYLERCLRSIVNHEPTVPHTVWVMNICPDPDDLEVAEAFTKEQGWNHYPSDENLRYSGSCNLAASWGDHEVIGLFNADTAFLDGTIDKCVNALMENPRWGILGPLQYANLKMTTHGGIFGSLNSPAHRGWHRPVRDAYRNVREAVTVSGSAYFVKRSVWDELTNCPGYQQVAPGAIGAFLPTPHYFEETFCSYHAQHHGWKVIYYGKAEMIHAWHKSPGRVDHYFKISQKQFREACDHLRIPHD